METPTVYIIDDDEAVREALGVLAETAGYRVETSAGPAEFFARPAVNRNACIVSDLRMPEIDGLAFQQELLRRRIELPMIMITAHGDVASAVTALRGGAVDYLEKPFDDDVFLARIGEALTRLATRREKEEAADEAAQRLAALTVREKEVADLMADGLSNKMIALRLDIGVRTVETHRAHIFEKLDIRTVPQLTRLVDLAREGAKT